MLESQSPPRNTPAAGEESAFAPVEAISGEADAGVLILCDHASNAIPDAYRDLGLPRAELARHIACDIGAAHLARRLAARLAAPALLTRFSRLIIDANRGLDDPTLVMRLSDGRIIPGNATVDAQEIAKRIALFWQPYRAAIDSKITAMTASGRIPVVVSIHSFTPFWKGIARPWQAGILWDSDARLAQPLIAALRSHNLEVGDNAPYDGALKGDTLDAEVTRRGLAGALVEIRQDLIATPEAARAWGDRLAAILTPILSDNSLHRQDFRPSRTGRHRPCARNEHATTTAE